MYRFVQKNDILTFLSLLSIAEMLQCVLKYSINSFQFILVLQVWVNAVISF